MAFQDTKQFKKGEIGEAIVKNILHSKGWITYSPDNNSPHYFDILATKNKQKVIAFEVKTKARFNKWPAQGIDERHYDEYINFVNTTNVPLYLIFIDDKTGDIHCADIKKLKNPFKPIDGIIAWMLEEMIHIGKIDNDTIDKLSQYDTRSHDFNPIQFNF
jgi:hypothetical protein